MRHIALCLLAGAVVSLGCGPEEADEPEYHADAYEVDDSRAQASSQSPGRRPRAHTFSPEGDVDWIRFRVTELDLDGDTSQSEVLEDSYGPWYELYLLNGAGTGWPSCATEVDLRNGSGTLETHPVGFVRAFDAVEGPGAYYLKVTNPEGKKGDYLSVVYAFKRRKSDVDLQAVDLVASDVRAPAEASDDATVSVSLRLGNIGDADAGAFTVGLYASRDRVLDKDEVDPLADGPPIVETVIAGATRWRIFETTLSVDVASAGLATGPWYLIAQVDNGDDVAESEHTPGSDVDASNNVCVGSMIVFPAGGDAADDTEDANDVLALTAPQLATELVDRTFDSADDVDYYRIEITGGGGTYEVWTDRLRGTCRTSLELLDDAGTPIAVTVSPGGEDGSAHFVHTFADGTYYVSLTNARNGVGAYDLHLREVTAPDDLEPDEFDDYETIRTWETLTVSAPALTRSITTADDVDWVMLPISVSDDYDIATTGLTTLISIYRSDGSVRLTPAQSPRQNVTLEPGLYYVKIESFSAGTGAYSLAVAPS
jgi:hypothetical protein